MFLGHIVQHAVLDHRDQKRLLLAMRTGHLGPTVFRSDDLDTTWQEAGRPPAFASGDRLGRSLRAVFWLTPGHADQAGVWYAGGTPPGLFRTEDGGDTWEPVSGWNDHPMWETWAEWPDEEGTPDGSMLHSVNVDPRDPSHLYIGLSGGGVFESLDAGNDWAPLNAGCAATFLPDPFPEFGHDPHCVRQHPVRPDRLYQQNHCGIYRLDRPDGRPGAYMTRDAGQSWIRRDRGLPERAWFTVKRQAMTVDACDPVGVYFGTTSGEIWASRDEGESWTNIAGHVPEIYSVEFADPLDRES